MKTIEEAAEEYADRYQGIRRNEAYDAFNAGADFAIANQWVSVEDEMPEYGVLVIARHKNGSIKVTEWREHIKCWRDDFGRIEHGRYTFTHWMPIPELKTEEL